MPKKDEQMRKKLEALLPKTFYADRDLSYRIERLVCGWQAAIKANQELEEYRATIEHAEYLAKAVERYQALKNTFAEFMESADTDRDEDFIEQFRSDMSEAWHGMSMARYEFRKRAERCENRGKPVSDACGDGKHSECTQDYTKCHCTFRGGHAVPHAYADVAEFSSRSQEKRIRTMRGEKKPLDPRAPPTPDKCPSCSSEEKSIERWPCAKRYGGKTDSWHSSASTPKGTK